MFCRSSSIHADLRASRQFNCAQCWCYTKVAWHKVCKQVGGKAHLNPLRVLYSAQYRKYGECLLSFTIRGLCAIRIFKKTQSHHLMQLAKMLERTSEMLLLFLSLAYSHDEIAFAVVRGRLPAWCSPFCERRKPNFSGSSWCLSCRHRPRPAGERVQIVASASMCSNLASARRGTKGSRCFMPGPNRLAGHPLPSAASNKKTMCLNNPHAISEYEVRQSSMPICLNKHHPIYRGTRSLKVVYQYFVNRHNAIWEYQIFRYEILRSGVQSESIR